MNARPAPFSPTPPPRFDRRFIEEHRLVERYLENKLPPKGARELELWCRDNPGFLEELQLSERAQSSLKLLEAAGRPADLNEPTPPWWKSVYVLLAVAIVALLSLVTLWSLFGKYRLLLDQIEDVRTELKQGPLVQPATGSNVFIAPDHAAGIDHARVEVNHTAPQLMDVHIDMGFTKLTQFRMVVDKKDQGRALIINNLVKDSNNELRLTLNSSGLAAGLYTVRLEGLPFRGGPIPLGWLLLEVR
jgi:hypothetical protein